MLSTIHDSYQLLSRRYTALLIVDPNNDFMCEGGKLYERTKETAEAVGFYDNMRKLIPAVRAAHIQVIIVPHHRWQEGDYNYDVVLLSVSYYYYIYEIGHLLCLVVQSRLESER